MRMVKCIAESFSINKKNKERIMLQKTAVKLFRYAFAALLLVSATGCQYGWHTVFFDNFNRVDGDLGKKWEVVTAANATVKISGKQALYSATAASDNVIICYNNDSVESSTFRASTSIKVTANCAGIEAVGFIVEPGGTGAKNYTLTFNKSCFAIGTTDNSTGVTTWLSSLQVNLVENTGYKLELVIEGAKITGYIKDSGGNVLHEVTAACDQSEEWSVMFLLMSKAEGTVLNFDDYRVEEYFAPEKDEQ